jgi:hypothetical protein
MTGKAETKSRREVVERGRVGVLAKGFECNLI